MDIDIKITFKRLHHIVDTMKGDVVNIPNDNIIIDELLGTSEERGERREERGETNRIGYLKTLKRGNNIAVAPRTLTDPLRSFVARPPNFGGQFKIVKLVEVSIDVTNEGSI